MLNMTKVELELIPDPDMFMSFEKGTKDWVSYISNRYRKANNKYLSSYDPKQEVNIYINTQITCMVRQWLSFFLPFVIRYVSDRCKTQ